MAYQSIKGGLWIPAPGLWGRHSGDLLFVSHVIDASAEKAAVIFQAPKTGTLDKFEFRTMTVNAAGTTSVLRCSFQDMNLATGNPDGTQDQFRDISVGILSNTWMVPGLMTSDGTDTGAKRSVTIGDYLCAVIEYQTFTATASIQIARMQTPLEYPGGVYNSLFTSSWAKDFNNGIVLALKYDDGTYETVLGPVLPATTLTMVTFNSGSTPDERGLRFAFTVPVKLAGCHLQADLSNDCDLVLYDSDGTAVLMSIAHEGNNNSIGAFGANNFKKFDVEVTLLKDTFYRLVLKPGGSNVKLSEFDVNAAAIMDAVPGGQNFHHTSRTNAGAWTDTTTKRPVMCLEISAVDDGVGGGMLRHPGMSAGIHA